MIFMGFSSIPIALEIQKIKVLPQILDKVAERPELLFQKLI